jgi:hypothetical protein
MYISSSIPKLICSTFLLHRHRPLIKNPQTQGARVVNVFAGVDIQTGANTNHELEHSAGGVFSCVS